MSKQALAILAIAGAILALLAYFGGRDASTAAVSGSGQPFVPGLEAALNDVERISVEVAGGRAGATLEKQVDRWVVVQKDGYRADVEKIRDGLRALAEARVLELKTANPELHDRLGVEDVAGETAKGVAVTLSAPGRDLPAVILGNTEGAKYRFARRVDAPQSYLIDRNPELPGDAARWVESEIVDLRGDRVRQVTITHPDGETVMISKSEPTASNFEVADIPEGRELLYAGVANVVGNALRELRLEDVRADGADGGDASADAPADPSADADADAAAEPGETVVEFLTFDGLVVVARGAKENDEAWVGFSASYDAARSAAADGADSPGGAAAPESTESDGSGEPAATAPAEEADHINARVAGWRYKIASYQFDQLTRRLSDLLKPPDA